MPQLLTRTDPDRTQGPIRIDSTVMLHPVRVCDLGGDEGVSAKPRQDQ